MESENQLMKAMILERIADVTASAQPLSLAQVSTPEPAAGEIRIRVAACGVCHTELDEIEGRTPPPSLPVIPGHEVIGYVEKSGANANAFSLGDRVGVGWIHSSSGDMDENISPLFQATGRDVNGGYAEYMTVPESYAYPIPDVFENSQAAPLLCAGGVGFRALRLTGLRDGERLGFTGFGGSAHIVLQIARHLYPNSQCYVFARDPDQRTHALELGADWAGDTHSRSPEKLCAIIDTTPAWTPVLEAMSNLRPGGRLVINAIRKENLDKEVLKKLDYPEHLWLEKEIKTVANVTRQDIQDCLRIAAEIRLRPTVETYDLEEANRALVELKTGKIKGAKVLQIKP